MAARSTYRPRPRQLSWIYMVEPGRMELRDEEVPILRKYLLNGGVLMADDFWGQKQWDTFADKSNASSPSANSPTSPLITHLPLRFRLKVPAKTVCKSQQLSGRPKPYPDGGIFGKTWEEHDDYAPNGTHDMHVRAIYDDKGRIMSLPPTTPTTAMAGARRRERRLLPRILRKTRLPLGINIVSTS